jgi:hypothetical protein
MHLCCRACGLVKYHIRAQNAVVGAVRAVSVGNMSASGQKCHGTEQQNIHAIAL